MGARSFESLFSGVVPQVSPRPRGSYPYDEAFSGVYDEAIFT